MNEKLEFTGERFTPECEREIWYEHLHRYAFAAQFCAGSVVLDVACGEGYGAALLAGVAEHVTGADISDQAISHASARYTQHRNLGFRTADCTQLPFADNSFDRVVSFETIEHLSAQEQMLSEFRRVLKPEGLLILSSPDKAEYSDKHGTDNPFHVKELYRDELEDLLQVNFPAFHILGQKLMFSSAIFDLAGSNRLQLQTLLDDESLHQGHVIHKPMYFLAICAAEQAFLPVVDQGMWLFDDAAESVYTHYHHEIKKNMHAGGLLASRDAEIESLKKQLHSNSRPWWLRWFKQD